MADERLTLKATPRTQTGKNANRRLRASGVVPAIFYTTNGESQPVQVKEAEVLRLYNKVGRSSLFNLEINGNVHPSLVWDIEYYPTQKSFQHIDFFGVDLDRDMKFRVALEFTGVAKGTKLGGKLEVYREQIFILSKPATLPRKIVVNVTNLDVNQGLRIADLVMPEGVRAIYDDNFAILNVNAPGAKGKDEEEDN